MSTAGGTAGADTGASAERESIRTATASDAEKEPLDEEGFLQDGEIWDDSDTFLADDATASNATPSSAKREKYPDVWPYFEQSSPEHLKFRVFVDYREPDDKLFFSFC